MSNLGRQLIDLPKNIEVVIEEYATENGDSFKKVEFKGRGKRKSINLPKDCYLSISNNTLRVTYPKDSQIWGTIRQKLQQIVTGLTAGFTKTLNISGIGYKASATKTHLILSLGYTRDLNIEIPKGIAASCTTPTQVVLTSHSLEPLATFAYKIAAKRSALKDTYKKKGIIVT